MMINSKHPFFTLKFGVVVKEVLIRFRSQPIMPGYSSEFAGIFEPNDGINWKNIFITNHN